MISPKQNNNKNNNKNEEEEEEEDFLPPFFDPILASDRKRFFDGDDDDCNDFDDDASISSSRFGKKKNTTTTSDKTTTMTPLSCAMNAEINGRFLLLSKDDDMQPDVARVLVLDNLFSRKEDDEEENDCVKAFTKALASVRIVSSVGKEEEEETTKKKNVVVVDVRTSEEAYWERETVDRKGDDDDANKTLGAKPFIVDAASRNGGVEGERMLFERLRKVFPQTVFARAPVESFVFEEEEEEGEEEDGKEETTRSKKRYAYDSIVYNASDENSNFRYHVDGDPMTLLHPKSPFAKAYGGNYANRSSSSRGKNGTTIAKPRFVSLLAYLNDEWNPEWGGETKFLDEDSQVGVLVGAKPGRVVLFDSDVKHSACATTRDDDDGDKNNRKRFSLVMKLIALPRKMLLSNANKDTNKTKNEEEEEEEEVDLLRVNPTMGFGAATPIGSAERLRGVVEAFSRKSIRV